MENAKSNKFINIVIPMSGAGSRFSKAGFLVPKPLLNINGKYMIEVVIDNLLSKKYKCNITLIIQEEMNKKYNFLDYLKNKYKNINFISINGITDGQLCSVLLAKQYINNDDYLLCANCDQYIDLDIDNFYDYAFENNLDGLIMTMPSDNNPKWSYSKTNNDGYVIKTEEKKVISNEATCGLYFFKKGKYLINAGEEMIKLNQRTNGEFYICPTYNFLIKEGKKIKNFNIYESMYGLGTPEDLCKFLVSSISRKV